MTADQDAKTTRRRTLTAEELRTIIREELDDTAPVINNYQPDFDRWNFLFGSLAAAAIVWAIMWCFVSFRESLDDARIEHSKTQTEQAKQCGTIEDINARTLCISLIDRG